jgi:hypothetical protein
MLGAIQLQDFANVKCNLPQKAASAWSGAFGGIVGASYTPLLYLGEQLVKGTNYYYIAQQTLVTATPIKRVALVVINEFQKKYEIVGVEKILG